MLRRDSSKKIIFVLSLWIVSFAAIFALSNLNKTQNKKDDSVVMTTYALTQIADTLHMDLTGVPNTQYQIPDRYEDTAKVGAPNAPSMEKIKKLNPDTVYSVTTLKSMQGKSYRSNNIDVTYMNLQTVSHLKKSLNVLGKRYDKEVYATKFINKLNRNVDRIKQKNKKNDPKKVLVLFGMPGGGYLQATTNSYIGSLVKYTHNTVIQPKNSKGEYISVNMEEIQKAKPDIVICLAHAMPDMVEKSFKEEFSNNQMWQELPAFQNKQVHYLREPVYSSTANMNVIKALNGIDKIVNEK